MAQASTNDEKAEAPEELSEEKINEMIAHEKDLKDLAMKATSYNEAHEYLLQKFESSQKRLQPYLNKLSKLTTKDAKDLDNNIIQWFSGECQNFQLESEFYFDLAFTKDRRKKYWKK